jgi:hypothetical protein
MITEDDLRESLRALERFAPDPEPVAARIAAGIRTQDRRRTAVMVAAAAATAVAVALPIALLGGGSGSGTPAAGPRPTATATAVPAAGVRFDPLRLPFTVGWLPAGYFRDSVVSTQPGFALHEYETRGGFDAAIRVQLWDTKVSGRSVSDDTLGDNVVRRQVGGDVWLAVAGRPAQAVLTRVLASVDVRSVALTFPFRLGWLPAGYRPVSASGDAQHWVGPTLATHPPVDAQLSLDPRPAVPATKGAVLSIQVRSESDPGHDATGTLRGHPSRYAVGSDGVATLDVWSVQGMHLSLIADTRVRPELTRAALEHIVTGLRLVPDPADPATWTPDVLP